MFISDKLIKAPVRINHNPPRINQKNPDKSKNPELIKSPFTDEQAPGQTRRFQEYVLCLGMKGGGYLIQLEQ